MNFVKVDNVPEKVTRRPLKTYFDEFMAMNIPIAEVQNHGYKSPKVCWTTLRMAAKRHAYPIDVRLRDSKVYLIRRDI